MRKQKADLLQGTLELLVLRLLSSGALNGWDIMQRIRLTSGEVLSVTPGALYPALHRLERDGSVASSWDSAAPRKRRIYTLTPAGEAALAAKRRHFDTFVAGVRAVLQRRMVAG